MNIPKKSKCLEETDDFLLLKTGNHKYCVFSKKEDQVIYEATSANCCFEYMDHINAGKRLGENEQF